MDVFWVNIIGLILNFFMMDTFSLEDDDCSDLFITQESRNVVPLFPNFSVNGDNSPNIEVADQGCVPHGPVYSDISDDDLSNIPSSQQVKSDKIKRLVY